ncbi:MAG: hypothetical protein GY696_22445 [Gammaproteobacteria bacterium]|nr:hypothetical protein [Gammaproteobacteria bacterium]
MSLREVSTAKDEREAAQGSMQEAIGIGVDTLEPPPVTDILVPSPGTPDLDHWTL